MAASYTRTYNNSLWPRCYASVSTDAATNCLSESAGAIKGYTVINVYPDINPRILTSTVVNAGFLGQPLEIFNAATTNQLIVPNDVTFGFSGIKMAYGQLCIGPLQTANFTFGPSGWVYTGNAMLAAPVGYVANTTGTQAAASLILVSNANISTVTNTSAAMKMPSATGSGAKVNIYNGTASTVGLYPATGQNFGTSAVNASTSLLASTSILLWDVVATTWAII